MEQPFLLFLGAALLLALALAWQAENKALLLLLLVWLLGYPTLDQEAFIPKVAALGFDLQPNRVLFLMLGAALLVRMVQRALGSSARHREPQDRWAPFEWFLVLYVLLSSFVMLRNGHQFTRRVGGMVTSQLAFLTAYLSARRWCSTRDLDLFVAGIQALAAFSALVGIIQFVAAPEFFRTGTVREAFAGYMRSTGVFPQEYDQGKFLIIALLTVFLGKARGHWRNLLLALLPVGIFLTMHRLSWGILLVMLAVYSLTAMRDNRHLVPAALLGGALALAMLLLFPWSDVFHTSLAQDFLVERVQEDTFTGRLALMRFGLDLVGKYPGGLGDFSSLVYNQEAYEAGIPFIAQGALVVHNGFLAAAVNYGIAGALLFAAFSLGSVLHFSRQAVQGNGKALLPALLCSTMLLYNLSNDFSFVGSYMGILFAILLGGFTAQRVTACSMGRERDAGRIPGEARLCPETATLSEP